MELEARALATRAEITRQQVAEAKEISRKLREHVQALKGSRPGWLTRLPALLDGLNGAHACFAVFYRA
jgi:hypothetical protein